MKLLVHPSRRLLLVMALWLPCVPAMAREAAVIVERYRSLLVSGYVPTAQASAGWTATEAPQWVATLADDGRWPDIDYENRAGGAWVTLGHLRRVRILAREIGEPKSALYHDAATERALLRALDHWTARRYQNPNWWQNQIGVPQVMRDIIVLLGERLTGESRAGAFAVLRQLKLMDAGIGANTVWSAELALMAAALEGDTTTVAQASQLIAGEIVVGAAQGVQSDFSFHQHGARLQQFHYGASFFQDTVRLAWLLRDTAWAIPREKSTLLADLAMEGSRWMSRGTVTVPGTLDRAVSRPGALRGADLRPELALLAELLPTRRSELAALAQAQAGEGAPLVGFRAFPRSDFLAHHRPQFSFFLKTISNRTEVTEAIVRENRKGKKLNWGDHYLLTPRSHYVDLPPVWNWDLLPGVTSSPEHDTVQRQAFVGALGDGQRGAAVMDYQVGAAGTVGLTARKFWATNGDCVVALIAELSVTAPGEPIRTALDQRRLRGAVTVADATGVGVTTGGGSERTTVKWIHHDGLVYAPLSAEPVSVTMGPVTGNWHAINLNYADTPVTESIFMPLIEHGRSPVGASSGYVIAASDTPESAAALLGAPPWRILRNDGTLQAVAFADGSVMAAFHAAGQLAVGEGLVIAVDLPCLVLVSAGQIRLSNPAKTAQTVTLQTADQEFTIFCPASGGSSEPVRL